MRRHKDGVDKDGVMVEAADWQEAMKLATPGTFFVCRDGSMVSFGPVAVKLR